MTIPAKTEFYTDITVSPFTPTGSPLEIDDQHTSSSTYDFDGINDFLGSTDTPIAGTAGSGTVSMWFKYTGTAAFFINQRTSSSTQHWYMTIQGNGRFDFVLQTSSGNSVKSEAAVSTVVNDDSWQHLLGTFDLTARDVNLFHNGSQVSYNNQDSVVGAPATAFTALPNLGIASLHNDNWSTGLDGSVSRPSFWSNTILTASQVLEEYNAELAAIDADGGFSNKKSLLLHFS